MTLGFPEKVIQKRLKRLVVFSFEVDFTVGMEECGSTSMRIMKVTVLYKNIFG